MEKELQEKVLMKIRKDKKLTEEEGKVVAVLAEKGLVKRSQDEVTLTRYGKLITVMGYDSVIRAEEMEKSLSHFSSGGSRKISKDSCNNVCPNFGCFSVDVLDVL